MWQGLAWWSYGSKSQSMAQVTGSIMEWSREISEHVRGRRAGKSSFLKSIELYTADPRHSHPHWDPNWPLLSFKCIHSYSTGTFITDIHKSASCLRWPEPALCLVLHVQLKPFPGAHHLKWINCCNTKYTQAPVKYVHYMTCNGLHVHHKWNC